MHEASRGRTILGLEVVVDVVRDAQVVAGAVEQVAGEADLLEKVLVLVVVVVAAQVGLEVADVERLAPAGLDVLEGGALADVRRGDLRRVCGEDSGGKKTASTCRGRSLGFAQALLRRLRSRRTPAR